MPLPSDLLNPVPGANPSGANLRYAPVYDKIKEARREEEEAPQGDWDHARKKADYPLVIKLSVESLRSQSKDLQLAAWLTEALLKTEGIAGLTHGLELIRGLIETFWDTLHPELEDGDAELRATPVEWVGSRLGQDLRHVPITRNGLDLLAYKESRAVGYEADAAGNDSKTKTREEAIADGKITGEQFDEGVAATPKTFYEERVCQADACLAAVEALDQLCEAKFGDYRPSFTNLRENLEELRDALNEFLGKKRALEPAPQPTVDQPVAVASEPQSGVAATSAVAQPAPAVQSVSKDPTSLDDAFERIGLVARYLRQQQPGSPVPYLLLRALRWGEVRANVGDVDVSLLEAPPTEVRKQLRKLLQESDWQQLLEATEAAMGQPSGRGWLDLQRYLVRACEGLGYGPVSSAIISELKGLLRDYPALPVSALNDETPAASVETQAWLAELVAPRQPAPAVEEPPPASRDKAPEPQPGVEQLPDAFDLAMQAARRGRPQEAIEILEREAAQERSGRGRFHRKMQLAQICMGAGFEMIALPVLEALAAEIDQRGLEEWEDSEVIIRALGLLYKCLHKLKRSPEQKERVYARICRLGPAQALELAKSA